MHPLISHLGGDDDFPNEDFEPHLFEHLAARWRGGRRPSVVRRIGSTVMHAVRRTHGASATSTSRPSRRYPAATAIRWG